ncbi:heterokaryon incompatibility protein-domain-containing protein [Biscogniauxia sp. FL1348]|nr:heterokaryon incompatibility protein-domain-containing protein [Biscogniauxia sp. FL1348]
MWCSNSFEFQRLRKRISSKHEKQAHPKDGTHSSPKLGKLSYKPLSLHVQDYDLINVQDRVDSKEVSTPYPHLVRLLRLIPSKEEGIITCQLQVKDINTNPRPVYHALSYTWGPTTEWEVNNGMTDDRKCPIICNGQELAITENLLNCLLQLEADSYYDKDLWIDAICVDQENHDERCQQISMMDDIYRSAERVVIWLGVADKFTQPASNLIRGFDDLAKEGLPDIEIENDALEHWFSVVSLFARTWFTRAWVVQEILLARDTVVFCGRYVLQWKDMVAMSHFLSKKVSANIFKEHISEDQHMKLLSYKNPVKLLAIKEDMGGGSRANVLLHSLIRCRIYDASNDHDKVYSLLGLVVPKGQVHPESLYPDYHLSVAKLYTNVTIYILENVEDLHVLAHAEGDDFKHIHGLPSWVPDWSFRANVGLRITRYRRYKAAGGLPCSKAVHPGGCLALRGAQLDEVTQTGDTKGDVNHSKTCTNWLALVEQLEREYSDRDYRDAFWRTLVGDTGSDGKVPVRESWGHEDAFAVWMGLKGEDGGDDETTPEQRRRAAQYETAFMHALHLRLFRTARGHLGLGTTSCRAGDLVWIVPGSRVPLLLRRVEGSTVANPPRYRLVGGTYLHGFMQGEALGELKEFRDIILI